MVQQGASHPIQKGVTPIEVTSFLQQFKRHGVREHGSGLRKKAGLWHQHVTCGSLLGSDYRQKEQSDYLSGSEQIT